MAESAVDNREASHRVWMAARRAHISRRAEDRTMSKGEIDVRGEARGRLSFGYIKQPEVYGRRLGQMIKYKGDIQENKG